MICKNCGHEVNPDQKFCNKCGKEINKGLIPELSGLQKLMYKIWYVDDHSKPLMIFLLADIAILALLIIAGIVLKNIIISVFAGCFIFIAIILLLMNNYNSKGFIQFKVGRNLVILMGMMTILFIFITIFTASIGFTSEGF